MIGIHRLTQACPTNPSRSRNRAILNCAILSIISQLGSIDRKAGLDSEITVSCYLHLCLRVFISFSVMFIAQFVRSKLISNAPIYTAFWSCCLLCFPHLLLFGMFLTFVALIYSFYFFAHIPYPRRRCKTPPLTSWVPDCGRGCNVHLYVALCFCNSLLHKSWCKFFYCLVTSLQCKKVRPWDRFLSQQRWQCCRRMRAFHKM